MLSRIFYIGVLFLSFYWTLEAKLHYAVIFPSEIRALDPQLACLDIQGASGESTVQLILSTGDGNITLIEKSFEQDTLFSCVPFQIPNPSQVVEETCVVDLSIVTPLEIVSKQSKVLLKKQRSMVFTQTDKPVYKPGQTVKFRILSLKENLLPGKKQISLIEVQDPANNRIGQWLNVTLNEGISEFSLPLSPEPTLGDYKIWVRGKASSFTVEEYLLPKFEIRLDLPKLVMFNSETIPAKVCGKYTFGKPIQGTYSIKVCRERVRTYQSYLQELPDLCTELTGRLDKSGCSSGEFKSENLELNKTGFYRHLKATATVTEDGTGVELNTHSKAVVTMVLEKAFFVDPDKTYKPGIPYSGTVKVQDGVENPVPDKQIYLLAENRVHSEKLTLVSDKNGFASFKLENTTFWEGQTKLIGQWKNTGNYLYSVSFGLRWKELDHDILCTVGPQAKTPEKESQFEFGIALPEPSNAYLYLSSFYSRSKSFLKLHSLTDILPCKGQQEVQLEYIIKRTELEAETKKLHFHYLMVSKGSLWESGTLEIPVTSDGEDITGTTSFNLHLMPDVAPNLRVLMYVLLPNGEIVADSAKFTVQRCFKNKVSVRFIPDEVLPGSDVSLQIQANPKSLCGLRVVDQSVVLMKPEKELTADQIHNLFPTNEAGGYDHRVQDYERRCHPEHSTDIAYSFGPWANRRPLSRSSRSILITHYPDDEVDVFSLFKDMSIKILTDVDIQKPLRCRKRYPTTRLIALGMPGPSRRFGPKGSMPPLRYATPARESELMPKNIIPETPPKAEIVRTYFPETWLWDLRPVGDSGSVEIHETAPDTITDWNAGALCMGPSGFGLSPPASLRVFQPFFVALTLPYSVIRGESFTLKCTVFNFLKDCIKVQTTLGSSEGLDEEPCDNCPRTSCLCADESKTFYWNLKATELGEVNITIRTEALDTQDLCHKELPIVPKQGSIDTVIKPLLVQPGGVLEEKAYSSLLCVQKDDGQSKQEVVSLTLPKNVLVDSERAYVTVLGDLMGTAMQNLDRLLAMPYGCGEQNMVLFAPNIVILQYLEKTQQMNEEILRKAKTFLQSGYQRQLTYKHDDGSYSAFGKSDKEGNTWLTAFVVKSFNKGRPYIFIDQTHLNHSFTWLKNHRHPNGCFKSVGKLFNTALKGGVDDETSLSAYATAALIEAGVPLEDPLVGDALSCLRDAAVNVTSMYTQALLAYTFALAGETEILKNLLEKLEKQAVRKDGQLHWERPSTKPRSELPPWYRAPSAEVELTSYMLLTELSGPEKDLGRASEMVNWLSKQQNPNGGFSSTQDTVVALQALAQYAEATYSNAEDVVVKVLSETGVQEFHVDHTNRLLLQTMPLLYIPGDYTLSATGSGCVYVQTVLRYNIPPPTSDATFVIRVDVKPDQCSEESVTKLQLNIYTEYTGSREKSNMALIEIKMLSGFIPVKSSVRELEKSKLIQRSEISIDMVTLYLDEVTDKAIHLSFFMEQDIEVKNLKPATVKVYDYYETVEYAITEYNSPCSAEKKTNH